MVIALTKTLSRIYSDRIEIILAGGRTRVWSPDHSRCLGIFKEVFCQL